MYHELVEPNPQELALAEAYADFAAQKLGGIPRPEVRFVREAFVREAALSRDKNLFYTPARAVGFVRDYTAYVRAGLTPTRLARVIVHECEHVRQTRLACRTLKVSYSLECDERSARLVEWEIFGDLPSRATYDEVIDYVKREQSKLLRAKCAPLIRRASERHLALLKSGGLKIPNIEYR